VGSGIGEKQSHAREMKKKKVGRTKQAVGSRQGELRGDQKGDETTSVGRKEWKERHSHDRKEEQRSRIQKNCEFREEKNAHEDIVVRRGKRRHQAGATLRTPGESNNKRKGHISGRVRIRQKGARNGRGRNDQT